MRESHGKIFLSDELRTGRFLARIGAIILSFFLSFLRVVKAKY